MEKSDLMTAFIIQIGLLIGKKSRETTSVSIETKEGRILFAYDASIDRINLDIFTINEEFKRKGIARSIIKSAIKLNRRVVAITGILPGGWFERIKNYKFEGFTTNIIPRIPWQHFNIEFVNNNEILLENQIAL